MTPRQDLFAHEFLIDLNATRAAIRAGYSEAGARPQGHRLLTNADVRAVIEAEQEARAKRLCIDADRVVSELAAIAFANIRDYAAFGPDGMTFRPWDELTDSQAAAVSSIEHRETPSGPVSRIRLHNKLAALELLGRHLGMFRAAS